MDRLVRLEKRIKKLKQNIAPHAYMGFIAASDKGDFAVELWVWERGKAKSIVSRVPNIAAARLEMDRLLTLYPHNSNFILNIYETPICWQNTV